MRVTDAPAGAEARLATAVSAALLRSEANVVDAAELARAAGRRGVARSRWADVGALKQVAQDIGAEHLLFAAVRGSELELFTLGGGGEIGASERVPLGRRAAPPSAGELDAALARLLARLSPPTAPPPGPTPPPAGPTPVAVVAPPPSGGPATSGAPPPPPPPSAGSPAGASSPVGNAAKPPTGGVSALQIGLWSGAGLLGIAGGCALAFGVVTGVDAMAQSNGILTLPKESPIRQERERAALDAAVGADISYGAAALLMGAAAGLVVWGAVAE